MKRTIEEINDRIRKGTVRVMRADEMTRLVQNVGPRKAAEEVDVVTTGTFGAMCSSGVWLNFGHSDPPIRMARLRLNGVEAYAGVAAVDAYLGATQPSFNQGDRYGGSHVIEDLVAGRQVVLRAESPGTDCYPRKRILTRIRLEELNHALLSNPRNAYQRYGAATNGGHRLLHTYMGPLLPEFGNVTFSGAGELSPLQNDPTYRTIGLGTRIFLGGGTGFVTGPGTQHSSANGFGTLAVQGDLRGMNARFLRAATIPGYGHTLYVGLGIPIPILDEDLALSTGIADEEIHTPIFDYSVSSRTRPVVTTVSYAELKSGQVHLPGGPVPSASLSSLVMAREVADTLREWILKGQFLLTSPVERLPQDTTARPLEIRQPRRIPGTNGRGEREAGIHLDETRCIQCGLCASLCPSQALSAGNGGVELRREACSGCGRCTTSCPVHCLELVREEVPA